jgi:hypothetical protein
MISDEFLKKCLQVLDNQGLVIRVGYDNLRWVASEFSEYWTIKTIVGFEQADADSMPVDGPSEGKTVNGRIWIDMYGRTITKVLNACLKSVFGHILQRPGIYEVCHQSTDYQEGSTGLTFVQAILHNRMSASMSRLELHEILDMLVEKGACKRVCFVKPPAFNNLCDALNRRETMIAPCGKCCKLARYLEYVFSPDELGQPLFFLF